MNRGLDNPEAWPRTGHHSRVENGLLRWSEAAKLLPRGPDRYFARAFPGTGSGRAMLACIFGASPFLGASAIREPGYVRRVWDRGPDRCVADALRSLRSLPPDSAEDIAARAIRVARRRILLATALADISQVWTLESVTGALTDFADSSCSVALRVLLTKLASRGAFAPPHPSDPERDSGLFVLGLGKLGGRELNFSSDIDLILLYDPDVVPFKRRYEAPQNFMRLGRWFVALLSEPTAAGRAFRVDLRLRPDPASTPLVLSTKSATRYYATRGQTWERAAMIKVRCVAGDTEAAGRYLKQLGRFVWRKQLDFATVQDLHEIKNRIDEQHRGGDPGSPGHNIKLGHGGIREIEFFTQAHQLACGGADPSLRVIPTCDALRALAAGRHISSRVTDALAESYRYLRGVEHRIQMVADRQTHSLPTDPEEFETLARFLGYASGEAFTTNLLRHLRQVVRQYESFFELPREITRAAASSALERQDRHENLNRLARMGFSNPDAAYRIVERWRSGSIAAGSGQRSRALLRSLTPSLLIATCGTHAPDLALRRVDSLIAGLGDPLSALSLLQANLHVMETVAEILVASPVIGTMLTARPSLLEVLLDPETDSRGLDRATLEADLDAWMRHHGDGDRAWDRLHGWMDVARFRVGIRIVFRSLDALEAPGCFSYIADCAAAKSLRLAEEEIRASHGRIPGARSAVVATGKLGRREMGIITALDVALYYEAPEAARSDGGKPIEAPEYFSKLARRMTEGLSGHGRRTHAFPRSPSSAALTFDALDRKLRELPAGRIDLGRPRLLAFTGTDSDRIHAVIGGARPAAGNPERMQRGFSALRGRIGIAAESVEEWDLEHIPGGLADIGVTAHFLTLAAMQRGSAIASGTIGDTLSSLRQAGALAAPEARHLREAWRVLTRVHLLRQLFGAHADGEVPHRFQPLVADAAEVESFDLVPARIGALASAASRVCDRILGRSTASAQGLIPKAGSPS